MSRFTRIGLVSIVGIAVGGYCIHAAQDKKPTAEAQIVVICLDEGQQKTGGLAVDHVGTQAAIVKSRAIIQRAIQLGKLDQLASLKVGDVVLTISNSLAVERSKDHESPLLKLRVSGLPANDAMAILDAVILAYREMIKEAYQSLDRTVLKEIEKASEQLETNIREAEAKFTEFVKANPEVGIDSNKPISPAQSKLIRTFENIANAEVDIKQMESRIDSISTRSKRYGASKEKVLEYIKFAEPKTDAVVQDVDEYIRMLKAQLAALESKMTEMKKSCQQTQSELRKQMSQETVADQLRDNIRRSKTLWEETVKVIRDHERKPTTGLVVRVLTKPHVVE